MGFRVQRAVGLVNTNIHLRRVMQPTSSERKAPALWTLWILYYVCPL